MRDAVAAIEAALKELVEARSVLPDDFAAEIDAVITQTQILLDSLGGGKPPAPPGGKLPESATADGG